ncbi:hypothetical protein JOB18_000659 [Solea senegalensis]|uniref:Uncharacterized protein n=1 Tax=Solea senegalensis TaxID=28829 RepID=A0AAV6T367_SOLSE|nr:hypothetical protein JOB18_000659 [Solea senegalensis]
MPTIAGVPKHSGAAKTGAVQGHLKQGQKNMGKIGTGTESNIQVINTKLVSVFATRFPPNVDADTLSIYLTEKLCNKSVTCRKVDLSRNRFSLFHITAECNEVADMFDPQLCPAGTYVRRHYEARRPRANGGEDRGPVGVSNLQRSVNTPAALHGSQSLALGLVNDSSQ